IRLHHAWWRALFNMSQYALSFAAAALVLNLAGVARLSEDAPHSRPGVVAVLAIFGSAIAWFVVNTVLVTIVLWMRFGGTYTRTVTRSLRQDSLWTLSLLALGPLVIAAGNVSALLVPL